MAVKSILLVHLGFIKTRLKEFCENRKSRFFRRQLASEDQHKLSAKTLKCLTCSDWRKVALCSRSVTYFPSRHLHLLKIKSIKLPVMCNFYLIWL